VAFRATDPNGNDIIASFAPILGTGWTLVSEDEWDAATSATQRYANTLLVLLALGMVLPALGVALLVRTQNAEILERERSVQEQRVAWLIQERLLPQVVPMLPGWNLEVFYKPHPASGGDFYDVYLLQDGRLALTLGHANVKGLDAAHVIDTMRAALRGAAQLQLPPDKALAHGNRLVCPELQGEACLTVLHAILDPATGRLAYASAGATPPWQCTGPTNAEIPVEGMALGKDMRCEYQQRSVTIQPGQCTLIFSEGLFRARRPSGELFDLAALQGIVTEPARQAEDMAEALAAQLKSYTGIKGMPPDDVTVIIVQRHAIASPNVNPRQMDRPASHALLAPDFDLGRGDLP
jgi:serine phosphatase RsbU (regulator of sigma subunit)